MPYSPAEVSALINVSASTVRSWTSQYSDFLTPAARGETGNRQYSQRDVSVLEYVAQLRNESMSRNAIQLRLRETRFGESETLAVKPAGKPTYAAGDVTDATQALALVQFVESRLDASQRSTDERLRALERTQRTAVSMFVTGVVIGFGLAIVLLALATFMS